MEAIQIAQISNDISKIKQYNAEKSDYEETMAKVFWTKTNAPDDARLIPGNKIKSIQEQVTNYKNGTTGGEGEVIFFESFDTNGNRIKCQAPAKFMTEEMDFVFRATYNKDNQIIELISSHPMQRVTYSYLENGLIENEKTSNSSNDLLHQITYSYRDDGQVSAIVYLDPRNTPIPANNYEYNDFGQLTGIRLDEGGKYIKKNIYENGHITVSMIYDTAGSLTQKLFFDDSGKISEQQNYVGNTLISSKINSYDEGGRLSESHYKPMFQSSSETVYQYLYNDSGQLINTLIDNRIEKEKLEYDYYSNGLLKEVKYYKNEDIYKKVFFQIEYYE